MTVYLIATAVTVGAASRAAAEVPSLALWVVLIGAAVAALIFPVFLDPTTGRRSSVHVAVAVVMAFTLPWAWAVLATTIAALVAGLHIRRYRTTPGGMLWGSSSMILTTAPGLAALHQIDARPLSGFLVAVVMFAATNHAVAMALGLFGNRPFALWVRLYPGLPWLLGLSLGAAAARVAIVEPAALVLFAVPYVAIVAAGSSRAVIAQQNKRLRAILDLADKARRESSTSDLEQHLIDGLQELLGGPVRLDATAPLRGEIGTPFPTPAEPNRWLVAGRRHGPPTWQGRYRADEVQALEMVAAVGSAVAESLHLLDHIGHLASHDPLTGLANRRVLDEMFERRIAEGLRHHRELAVLMIDLDHFKAVNDALGRVAADDVLVSTARRLEAVCRADDIIARWGGEEFVVIAELHDSEDLEHFAQRVCNSLRYQHDGPDGPLAISASVGAARWPQHGESADAVLRVADDVSLEAKRAGRDRVIVAPTATRHAQAEAHALHALQH